MQMRCVLDIDAKDLCWIKNLILDRIAAIGRGDQIFQTGVKLGSALSPDLLPLSNEKILRGIKDMNEIQMNGISINNIGNANYKVLIAHSEIEL